VRIQIVDSDRRCPRDSSKLVADAGQNDTEGDLEVLLECWECGYREMQRPERDKTSDGPPLSMAALRDRVRDPKPVPPPAAFLIDEETQR
jgi:hypothetical protein